MYKDDTFTEPYLAQPTFSCLGKENCNQRVFIGIELDSVDTGKIIQSNPFNIEKLTGNYGNKTGRIIIEKRSKTNIDSFMGNTDNSNANDGQR